MLHNFDIIFKYILVELRYKRLSKHWILDDTLQHKTSGKERTTGKSEFVLIIIARNEFWLFPVPG